MQNGRVMTTFDVVLLFATMLNGLLAGVFFTWTNAITPGIGKLSDIGYLASFQSMNRTILNPLFYVVFFGSMVFSPWATILQYDEQIDTTTGLLLAVSFIYALGVIVITFLGNIPLNNRLDKLDLENIHPSEAAKFRASYESQWNRLHFIRTVCSSTTFTLLLIICFSH